MLKFYNTMSRKMEEFKPLDPSGKIVKLYTCGPTVYNYAHIGNMRTYVWEDFLQRTLEYMGYEVLRVLNITDVDDKTIRDSQATQTPFFEFTEKYTKAFLSDVDLLHIEHATHYPRATEFIPQIIEMIETLIANDHAYEADGSVYFRIASFADYGKLSGRVNKGTGKQRVVADEYDEKEGAQDFALWKAWKPEDGEVKWDSPWGAGRPGWHIECSAMSKHYLGDTFDIHCGGKEHLFPHHENEIAQSEASSGKQFVKYWLHGEWLQLGEEKMSKSLGNIYTLRDLMDKGYSPRAYRYYMLTANYRMPVIFTFDGMNEAMQKIERFDEFWYAFERGTGAGAADEVARLIAGFDTQFSEALEDDCNAARALSVVYEAMRAFNGLRSRGILSSDDTESIKTFWKKIDAVFAFLLPWEEKQLLSENEIEQLIEDRKQARKNKDFSAADRIRKDLLDRGIVLEDTPGGTIWRRK